METSPIYELLPAFRDRNQVTDLLLGLRSLSREWLDLLEQQAFAPHPPEETARPAAQEEPAPGLVYCLLGMVSFANRLASEMEAARKDSPLIPDGARRLTWGEIGELLR